MSRVALITGGAKSGKSQYACERARRYGNQVLFIATCVPQDEEMREKVARHRAERPQEWTTIETGHNVAGALSPGFSVAIVDCLTLLISTLMLEGAAESDILGEVERLSAGTTYPLLMVTNEVGWGIVPENSLARRFREIHGRANRLAAERADDVVLMVAGIPLTLKGEPWKP